jgi:hypothetical protein
MRLCGNSQGMQSQKTIPQRESSESLNRESRDDQPVNFFGKRETLSGSSGKGPELFAVAFERRPLFRFVYKAADCFKLQREVLIQKPEMFGNLLLFGFGDAVPDSFVYFRILSRETYIRKVSF